MVGCFLGSLFGHLPLDQFKKSRVDATLQNAIWAAAVSRASGSCVSGGRPIPASQVAHVDDLFGFFLSLARVFQNMMPLSLMCDRSSGQVPELAVLKHFPPIDAAVAAFFGAELLGQHREQWLKEKAPLRKVTTFPQQNPGV